MDILVFSNNLDVLPSFKPNSLALLKPTVAEGFDQIFGRQGAVNSFFGRPTRIPGVHLFSEYCRLPCRWNPNDICVNERE